MSLVSQTQPVRSSSQNDQKEPAAPGAPLLIGVILPYDRLIGNEIRASWTTPPEPTVRPVSSD